MSLEQQQRREAILRADDENQYAVVELLSRSYVEDFPEDDRVWFSRAMALDALCRYKEADECFERALSPVQTRNAPYIWVGKARSYSRRRNYQQAEECYLQAKMQGVDDGWLMVLLAHCTWRRGDLNLAERRFRDAVAMESEEKG